MKEPELRVYPRSDPVIRNELHTGFRIVPVEMTQAPRNILCNVGISNVMKELAADAMAAVVLIGHRRRPDGPGVSFIIFDRFLCFGIVVHSCDKS